jgi:uncharacterized membrane protein YfcA
MHLDPGLIAAGLVGGFMVGLTGMGGGALMTPMLILLFKVQPLAAVSSDLVTSLFMKPVGGFVHLRRGTVRKDIALWLSLSSVPAAFCGVLAVKLAGAQQLNHLLTLAIGATLLTSAGAMVLRARLDARRTAQSSERPVHLRKIPTLAIGALGGFLVGMTSVGSGSLIIVLLLAVYPGLVSSELVGTDIVQAVPLVGAAAIGHTLFGDVRLSLTGPLLIGAFPGVLIGALLSSRTNNKVVRPALFMVLAGSGLKLLQAF